MGKIVFPPILSRRFGLSLGVDLSPSKKQCNFDCLYCELKGAKTVDKMADFPSTQDVADEISAALEKYPNIDVITLTANGEPTLYPHLKELVGRINQIKKNKKLLILSNGSLAHDPNVRRALLDIDIVKFSLDSASERVFKKLDRPHKSLDLAMILDGMKKFALEFKNELVIEVLVVENFNDTRDEFLAINEFLNLIKPARVDIGTIDRPSAYRVNSVSFETLEILSREIKNIPVVIAKRAALKSAPSNLSDEEILRLLKMRPQSREDVENLLDTQSCERLEKLLLSGKVALIEAANVAFYKLA